MRYRDSPILAYSDGNRIVCRLCILEERMCCILVFGDKCHDRFECCSCGNLNSKNISNKFKFDNTKHEIVISKGHCNICTCFNLLCVTPCRYDIKKDIVNIIDIIDSTPRRV